MTLLHRGYIFISSSFGMFNCFRCGNRDLTGNINDEQNDDDSCTNSFCICCKVDNSYKHFDGEENKRQENVPWRRRLCTCFTCSDSHENEGHQERYDNIARQKNESEQQVDQLNKECNHLRTSNDDLLRQKNESQQQLESLSKECNKLRTSNDDLLRQKSDSQQQLESLTKECNELRTRLSEMASVQLTYGNPNIADLSDPHRQEKVAEQFSELYDNEWTDYYEVLSGDPQRTEEEIIQILLQIVQTSYQICLEKSQIITTAAKESIVAFAGISNTEPDKAFDVLIQETFLNLRSFRAKSFKAVPASILEEINKTLLKSRSLKSAVADCGRFIEQCVNICWLMCMKDPPMYIFCDKEALFDQTKYIPYTKSGPEVSYVVWPVLYLYENGPLMRKGVAQGKTKDDHVYKTHL